MKKLLLITMIMAALIPLNGYAAIKRNIEIALAALDTEHNNPHKNIPDKGQRMPGLLDTCYIDFESYEVRTSINDEVISYELWTEDGTSSVASFSTDSSLVMYMYDMDGCYQLRLVTGNYSYTGYIEL